MIELVASVRIKICDCNNLLSKSCLSKERCSSSAAVVDDIGCHGMALTLDTCSLVASMADAQSHAIPRYVSAESTSKPNSSCRLAVVSAGVKKLSLPRARRL